MDDTNLAYLCDDTHRADADARGVDPDDTPRQYAKLINDSFASAPADMIKAMHLCRGNFRSSWAAEGGYEPVAEIMFNELDIDAFFLEYDDPRSGDFAPLRFLPKGKTVVLGLVTTKLGELESKDEVKRRIDEATQVRRHRPARAQPAVRLRLDRPRQRHHHRAAGRQDPPGDRGGRGSLGLGPGDGGLTDRPPPSACAGHLPRKRGTD